MSTKIANILCLAFIAIAVTTAAFLYPSLPDQIPTHWNIEGQVDGTMSKPWGMIILPLSAIFVFLLMKVIPAISPQGFRTEKFTGVLNIFTVALVGFMSGVALLVLLEGSGRNVYINEMIFAGVGLLFIIMGSYLGKVRKNFFLGIKTPWTLASDEVWDRTHRFGGRIFVLIGFFLFLNAFVRFPVRWLLGATIVAALVPVVYSYFLYRRVEGFTPDNSGE
ncbi:MAG: putative membrane protein [Woeseiaceae bacterium]|jgi:uncharacterized membrane protein